MSAAFETLEKRTMMSASLSNSVLNILGSAVADVITVAQGEDRIRVTENGVTRTFKVSKVKSIVVDGAGGDDRIVGDNSLQKSMTARGGEGSDTFISGPKADTFEGGAGTDTADYSGRSTNQTISLDDVANDGVADEKDNIKSDVENVKTGSGNDMVTGSALANVIETSDGNDTVNAGDGPDTVRGGWGNDLLNGEGGSDALHGQAEAQPYKLVQTSRLGKKGIEKFGLDIGTVSILETIRAVTLPDNDVMNGGAGFDTITGYGGNDTLSGGDWRDSIFGNEGNDSISGGAGDDIIEAGEGNDVVWGNAAPGLSIYDKIIDADIKVSAVSKMYKAAFLNGPMAFGSSLTSKIGKISSTVSTAISAISNKTGIGSSVFSPIEKIGSVIDKIAPYLNLVSDVDVVFGGAGDDSIHGNGDGDTLSGDAGNDRIWGDEGDDVLRGNNNNDSLYGGAGADNMSGDAGDDELVAVGGGNADSLYGAAGTDSFWMDDVSTETTDSELWSEGFAGRVHRVASFMGNVSKELNGQNLTDPNPFDFGVNRTSAADDVNPVFNNFKNNPLFSAAGPRDTDIDQNAVGDCYFLAVLAGAAKQIPFKITKNIVDLGDGTYAVEFRNADNAASFVRVDADLPVQFAGSTTPYYGGLGADNSLWGAIYEKAFCTFRGAGGSYDSINSGWSREAFNALAFRDGGDMFVTGDGNRTLANIREALAQGKIVTLATNAANPPADIPAVRNHVYVVDRINTTRTFIPFIGWLDLPTSVTLRNPWGNDGGTSADANVNDGLVTFTADQIQRFFRRADAAWSV